MKYSSILLMLLPLVLVLCFSGCVAKEHPVHKEPATESTEATDPFSVMSKDWGSELYESGFVYYEIPTKYIAEGGNFPETVQAYLWSLCKQKGIDYYIVVALIERESGYRHYAYNSSAGSKGYMQICEKWHRDRMAEEYVEDLFEPYGNIRVGLNYLEELIGGEIEVNYHYVLMSYNMGEGTAKKHFREGTFSSKYSRAIIQRAQEIEKELKG